MMFTKALIPFAFDSSLFLLAYMDVKFVGRIDSSAIFSRLDGSKKAYLDWICVIKSDRQKVIACKFVFGYNFIFKRII